MSYITLPNWMVFRWFGRGRKPWPVFLRGRVVAGPVRSQVHFSNRTDPTDPTDPPEYRPQFVSLEDRRHALKVFAEIIEKIMKEHALKA